MVAAHTRASVSLATPAVVLIVSHVRHEVAIWMRATTDAPWLRQVVTSGQSAELGLGIAFEVDDLSREPLPH